MPGEARRRRLSRVEFDFVNVVRPDSSALGSCHLTFVDGQRVMPARIEVSELINPIEHLRDELAQIKPGRDTGASAKAPRDPSREVGDVTFIDDRPNPSGVLRLLREQFADT